MNNSIEINKEIDFKNKKKQSTSGTRERLEQALQRLIDGAPLVVASGTKVSPTSVAREAGVDRVTLYRYHAPVLLAIKNKKNSPTKKKNGGTDTNTALIANLRKLTEIAQEEVASLARINYRLDSEKDELKELLKSRDRVIRDLRQRLLEKDQSKIVTPYKKV